MEIGRERCAAASRARGETTAGTLGFFDIGVFVEGFTPFPRLALKSLAPRLHEFNLKAWERFQKTRQGLHPRILPIRRDRNAPKDSSTALFCLPAGDGSCLQLNYALDDPDELSEFDLVAMRDRPLDFAAHSDDTFRVIVCTHGKVDPCCAVDGNAVYRHLARSGDVEVWHGAHFGGCRFAANVWCLPSGNCYGHVSARNVDALIDAEQSGQVYQHGFRGRIGQNGVEAAAEAFARQHYDQWAARELFVECSLDGPGSCSVAVHHADGTVGKHRLEFEPDPASYYLTCRAVEPSSPMRTRFQAHSATRTVAFGQRFLPQPKPSHHLVGIRPANAVRSPTGC